MEMIRIANGDYDRYEELLLKYAQIDKESYYIQEDYIRVFGELNNELFRLKIECIRLKKAITWCQTRINQGERPDPEELEEYLRIRMAAYQEQLEDMVRDWENSKKMQPISAAQAEKVKTIYRRLAKKLHPDINPMTRTDPVLKDLFQRVMIAYQCNDLVEIQGLEVLAEKALKERNGESAVVVIENIEEKIAELEERIGKMTASEPYILKTILEDPERVEKKKDEIRQEIEEYREYQEKLTEYLDSIK